MSRLSVCSPPLTSNSLRHVQLLNTLRLVTALLPETALLPVTGREHLSPACRVSTHEDELSRTRILSRMPWLRDHSGPPHHHTACHSTPYYDVIYPGGVEK